MSRFEGPLQPIIDETVKDIEAVVEEIIAVICDPSRCNDETNTLVVLTKLFIEKERDLKELYFRLKIRDSNEEELKFLESAIDCRNSMILKIFEGVQIAYDGLLENIKKVDAVVQAASTTKRYDAERIVKMGFIYSRNYSVCGPKMPAKIRPYPTTKDFAKSQWVLMEKQTRPQQTIKTSPTFFNRASTAPSEQDELLKLNDKYVPYPMTIPNAVPFRAVPKIKHIKVLPKHRMMTLEQALKSIEFVCDGDGLLEKNAPRNTSIRLNLDKLIAERTYPKEKRDAIAAREVCSSSSDNEDGGKERGKVQLKSTLDSVSDGYSNNKSISSEREPVLYQEKSYQTEFEALSENYGAKFNEGFNVCPEPAPQSAAEVFLSSSSSSSSFSSDDSDKEVSAMEIDFGKSETQSGAVDNLDESSDLDSPSRPVSVLASDNSDSNLSVSPQATLTAESEMLASTEKETEKFEDKPQKPLRKLILKIPKLDQSVPQIEQEPLEGSVDESSNEVPGLSRKRSDSGETPTSAPTLSPAFEQAPRLSPVMDYETEPVLELAVGHPRSLESVEAKTSSSLEKTPSPKSETEPMDIKFNPSEQYEPKEQKIHQFDATQREEELFDSPEDDLQEFGSPNQDAELSVSANFEQIDSDVVVSSPSDSSEFMKEAESAESSEAETGSKSGSFSNSDDSKAITNSEQSESESEIEEELSEPLDIRTWGDVEYIFGPPPDDYVEVSENETASEAESELVSDEEEETDFESEDEAILENSSEEIDTGSSGSFEESMSSCEHDNKLTSSCEYDSESSSEEVFGSVSSDSEDVSGVEVSTDAESVSGSEVSSDLASENESELESRFDSDVEMQSNVEADDVEMVDESGVAEVCVSVQPVEDFDNLDTVEQLASVEHDQSHVKSELKAVAVTEQSETKPIEEPKQDELADSANVDLSQYYHDYMDVNDDVSDQKADSDGSDTENNEDYESDEDEIQVEDASEDEFLTDEGSTSYSDESEMNSEDKEVELEAHTDDELEDEFNIPLNYDLASLDSWYQDYGFDPDVLEQLLALELADDYEDANDSEDELDELNEDIDGYEESDYCADDPRESDSFVDECDDNVHVDKKCETCDDCESSENQFYDDDPREEVAEGQDFSDSEKRDVDMISVEEIIASCAKRFQACETLEEEMEVIAQLSLEEIQALVNEQERLTAELTVEPMEVDVNSGFRMDGAPVSPGSIVSTASETSSLSSEDCEEEEENAEDFKPVSAEYAESLENRFYYLQEEAEKLAALEEKLYNECELDSEANSPSGSTLASSESNENITSSFSEEERENCDEMCSSDEAFETQIKEVIAAYKKHRQDITILPSIEKQPSKIEAAVPVTYKDMKTAALQYATQFMTEEEKVLYKRRRLAASINKIKSRRSECKKVAIHQRKLEKLERQIKEEDSNPTTKYQARNYKLPFFGKKVFTPLRNIDDWSSEALDFAGKVERPPPVKNSQQSPGNNINYRLSSTEFKTTKIDYPPRRLIPKNQKRAKLAALMQNNPGSPNVQLYRDDTRKRATSVESCDLTPDEDDEVMAQWRKAYEAEKATLQQPRQPHRWLKTIKKTTTKSPKYPVFRPDMPRSYFMVHPKVRRARWNAKYGRYYSYHRFRYAAGVRQGFTYPNPRRQTDPQTAEQADPVDYCWNLRKWNTIGLNASFTNS